MRPAFLTFLTFFITSSLTLVSAADPTATRYGWEQCAGSLRPYPAPEYVEPAPDSLKVVFINHVGRHGSRFPASAGNVTTLLKALDRADSLGCITSQGRRLQQLSRLAATMADGRWGALDSLGMAEERGIASRMLMAFPEVFNNGRIDAISSYSPRCVASMYEFTHQLDRLNNRMEISTNSGRNNSKLLRPFDLDADFTDYIKSKVWETPYNDYAASCITAEPLRRILGSGYEMSQAEMRKLAMAEYYVVAGMGAMGIDIDPSEFFTLEEYNSLWSCFNLRQYLQRTANTISSEPALVASELLLNLIMTTDNFVEGNASPDVMLRFGHAETLLPLLSLMHLDGCYYLTNYFDTVASHFRDFDIVPMGANLQMLVLKDKKGRHYVRFDLNEKPVTLIPGDERIYIPWGEVRNYLVRCLPLFYQP